MASNSAVKSSISQQEHTATVTNLDDKSSSACGQNNGRWLHFRNIPRLEGSAHVKAALDFFSPQDF